MADGTVDTPVAVEPTAEQQIAQQMALQGVIPMTPEISQAIQPPTQATLENPPASTDSSTVSDGSIPRDTFDFKSFAEKYGYANPEDALAEIEQLRALKAAPPAVEPLKFENEQSEKLFKLWQAGKMDEVKSFLYEQDQLNKFTNTEVNDDTAGDIIKAAMKVQYPNLTTQEVDYKYNKQYKLPAEPRQGEDELDEVFADRKAQWQEQVNDIKMSKTIDAKLALPHLETAKAKLIFPTLETPVDEGYASYQQMMADTAQLEEQTREAYKNVTAADFVTKMKFVDAKNGIDHDFSYQPDEQLFKQAVEIVSDNSKFFSTFLNSDGSPNRQLWVDAIMYALGKDKILTHAMMEGSLARVKAQLPDNSNGGFQRMNPQDFEGNELDAAMAASGIRKGGI